MELSIIKTEKQYQQYLDWVDKQLDINPPKNSAEGKKLEVALLLIKKYEDEKYPVPYPDPIEAIKLKMEEMGIRNKDLVGIVGSKGYISSILSKRKPLTLEIARIFHKELHIPADVLLA